MIRDLNRYTHIVSIVGDIIKVRAEQVPVGHLAIVENF